MEAPCDGPEGGGLLWLLVGLAPALWLFRSNGFLHYGQVVSPYFVVIVSELWVAARVGDGEARRPRGSLRAGKVLLAAYALLFVLVAGGMGGLSWAKSVYSLLFVREVDQYATAEAKLVERIPEDERDYVIAYNTDTGFYLWFDIQPCYRFFCLQDWNIQSNETLREKLLEDYGTLAAKWVLVEDAGAPTAIDGILAESCRVVAEEPKPSTGSVYRLWQLDESKR